MSCEVAVMNKRGVALAADSAVTLGERKGERKVYYAAEKLFQLSPGAPIAILTYGSADMMGVPWETVVKMFSRKIGDRRFDTVEQYAEEFLRFLEDSSSLFPESAQARWFQSEIGEYWSSQFADSLKKLLKEDPKATPKRARSLLSGLVDKDIVENWNEYELIAGLGEAYGDSVLSAYARQIDEVEEEVFKSIDLPSKTKQDLRTIVRHMYTKQWTYAYPSGVVVAGIGESEPFPSLVHYRVGALAAGRLRSYKVDEVRVTDEDDGSVISFAQTEVIDMFYRGIFPELQRSIPGLVLRCLGEVAGPSRRQAFAKLTDKFEAAFRERLDEEISEKYTNPLTAVVSALPRYELAKLAEALVSLTALRAHVSEEAETVGGPIDVAIISKGDGFVWVKKKDLVHGDVPRSEAFL